MTDDDNDICENFEWEKAPTKKNYETLITVLTDSMKKRDRLLADIKAGIAELKNDRKEYSGILGEVETMIARLESEG